MEEKDVLEETEKSTDNADTHECEQDIASSLLSDGNVDSDISDGTDQNQIMRDILIQMNKLTDDVQFLRKQLEEKSSNESFCVNNSDVGKYNEPNEQTEINDKSTYPRKKKTALSVISNIVFYTLIVALVFGAFLIRSNKNGRPWMIGNYSAMTVLSSSMEDVYPKGSLIITKSVDADKLKIGDDITYMTGENSSITHRIIGINEDYFDTGERGFETQGVMNSNPDKDIVSASNVVGRVVFSSETLGSIANFITKNWPILLFFVFVVIMLLAFLKWNARRSVKSNIQHENKMSSDEQVLNSENKQKIQKEKVE